MKSLVLPSRDKSRKGEVHKHVGAESEYPRAALTLSRRVWLVVDVSWCRRANEMFLFTSLCSEDQAVINQAIFVVSLIMESCIYH